MFLSSLRGAHARLLLFDRGSRPQLIEYHLCIKFCTVTDIEPRPDNIVAKIELEQHTFRMLRTQVCR